MSGIPNQPPSRTSQTRDKWHDWNARAGELRSALLSGTSESRLAKITSECVELYTEAVETNTDNALATVSCRDRSPLEAAFMWLGGWRRPSSAITLVYSTLGASTRELNQQPAPNTEAGVSSTFPLSDEQLKEMANLQKLTRENEASFSDEHATLQMLVADQNMAEALAINDISSMRTKDWNKGLELMEMKIAALTNILIQANELRLQTLQELVKDLSPTQCAHCCISAFELVHAIRAMSSASSQQIYL